MQLGSSTIISSIVIFPDTYRVLIDRFTNNISLVRKKVKESENYLKRLNGIKNAKDTQFEKLRVQLEDLQRKSMYVDKSLFEKGVAK